MAEFSEVIKQFKRMCRYYNYKATQHDCPLYCKGHGCNISRCHQLAFEDKQFQNVVMSWAAEHPESVYPTWWKYMCMIGVIPEELGDKTLGEVTIDSLMHTRIQSDIAEKLGIEPKDGA